MALERDAIICPYCGFRDQYWHEYVDPASMEEDFTLDCEDCGNEFEVKMTTDVWFETKESSHEEDVKKKINNRLKKAAQWFFLETKFGIWIMSALAVFNALEGFIHLFTAAIGAWGAIDLQVWDIRVWFPTIENVITGGLSLLTAWALNIGHHHHNHHSKKGD